MSDFVLLIVAMAVVVHSSSLASRYAERIAENFHMSKYLVGFIVVSFVSILPETFIAVSASFQNEPSLGLGTLFGSNVIDLTLIMAILVLIAGKRGVHVEKSLLKKLRIYPLFLSIPLLLGIDGRFSREEGLVLIIIGLIFYYYIFRRSIGISSRSAEIHHPLKNSILFLGSMGLLLAGAHFASSSAVSLAHDLGVSPILIGVLIVSFGTTLPELFFSAKAVQQKKDSLAIGDMLGSVLADATIVVGIVAMITPFGFPRTIAYITGSFMVGASIVLLAFMHSQYKISRLEAVILIVLWLGYVVSELMVNYALH